MDAKDVIRSTMDMSEVITNSYLNDLSDDEFRAVPVEGMNPIALQVGHLISAERTFMETLRPGVSPALPEGFDEAHKIKADGPRDAGRYLRKDDYLRLWKAQREASKKVLEMVPESELEDPAHERFRAYVPTVGAMLNMVGVHPLMHCGQYVAVRRKLGKPVAI